MRRIYREPGLMLIPLPFGYGLNIGRNYSGYWAVRTWAWSLYDFADHVSTGSSKAEWADNVLRTHDA